MILLFALIAIIGVILILNTLVLRTNYWNNRIEDMRCIPKKRVSNKYRVCCLGGSSARYAYEFDDSVGINLATNSQSLSYDLKMLRRYQKTLCKGAYVIVTFSDETLLMTEKYQSKNYKYMKYLDKKDIKKDGPFYFARNVYIPILFSPSVIKYIFNDVAKYDKFAFTSNPCSENTMIDDCIRRMEIWEAEYHLSNSIELEKILQENLAVLKNIINTIRNAGATPVFVVQPKSETYQRIIGNSYWPVDTGSIIQDVASQENIRIIDFSKDLEFSADTNYINALCYNSNGRKNISEELLEILVE